jgi:hypothetical protein
VTTHGIAAEDKIVVVKRLRRSPDRADAAVMFWYKGVPGVTKAIGLVVGDNTFDPADILTSQLLNDLIAHLDF